MTISRRTFIKGTIATSAVAAGTSSCGNPVSAAPIVEVTVETDNTSDLYGQISVPVPRYPDLNKLGGAVTLLITNTIPSDATFKAPQVGVLLVNRGPLGDPNAFIATRSDCPHQGCPLGYSASQQQIECPCHGSRFLAIADASDPKSCVGLVTHLPAANNLTVWATRVAGDYVFVDLTTDQSCGTSTSFPAVVNGTVTVDTTTYPGLATVGGTLVGKPSGLGDTLIIARVASDKLICLSAVCTHKQCTIGLDLANSRMDCPCHGSEYGYDGSVLQGPSTTPVKAYAVTFDGTKGVISTT